MPEHNLRYSMTVRDALPGIPLGMEFDLRGLTFIIGALIIYFVILYVLGTRHPISTFLLIPFLMLCVFFPVRFSYVLINLYSTFTPDKFIAILCTIVTFIMLYSSMYLIYRLIDNRSQKNLTNNQSPFYGQIFFTMNRSQAKLVGVFVSCWFLTQNKRHSIIECLIHIDCRLLY